MTIVAKIAIVKATWSVVVLQTQQNVDKQTEKKKMMTTIYRLNLFNSELEKVVYKSRCRLPRNPLASFVSRKRSTDIYIVNKLQQYNVKVLE